MATQCGMMRDLHSHETAGYQAFDVVKVLNLCGIREKIQRRNLKSSRTNVLNVRDTFLIRF